MLEQDAGDTVSCLLTHIPGRAAIARAHTVARANPRLRSSHAAPSRRMPDATLAPLAFGVGTNNGGGGAVYGSAASALHARAGPL